ncbi:MAG: ABC transporter substrate-binding protein [Massiliimalia sp.]|jgi:raffinose/stachyose/melibiose transport system substrate-binding protein
MKRKWLAMILAGMLTATAFTGCGGSNDKNTSSGSTESSSGEVKTASELTLYAYYADSGIEQIDKTLEVMKDIYPDLTINIEHRTDSDGSVLKTRAAVGELPDMFECTGQLTDILMESGDLAPLDDAMEEAGMFDKYLDGTFDAKKASDGHYYAVQSDIPQACLMFYNIEIFDQLGLTPPKNFDELKTVVQTLVDNDIIPVALFAQQKWPGLQMYDMAVVAEGQPLGLAGLQDGTAKITDEAYVNAANKVKELVDMGLIGKGALNTNASQAFELFSTGKAGMVVNGAWYFNDAALGGYGDNMGYCEFNPFADAGKEEEVQWTMSGGAAAPGGYAVSAKGEYVEFSKQVLMTYIEEHDRVCAQLGSLCMLKETVEPETPRAASYQAYADSMKNFVSTTPYEWSLNNQELIVALEDTSELLITGTYTADQFIEDLDASIAEIIG